MVRSKQLSLLRDPRKNTKLWWIQKQNVYGGSLNYRKVARPFDAKKLSHTVFKARLAPNLGFDVFGRDIRRIILAAAKRYGMQVRELAIQSNHFHLLTFTKSRKAQTCFLRLLASEIGRYYARLRRKMHYSKAKLWLERPFTRLVGWGVRSRQWVTAYIRRNRYEATGFLEWKPRNHRLEAFLNKWSRLISSA